METGGAEGHSLSGLAGKRRDSVNSGRAAARTLAKAPGAVNAEQRRILEESAKSCQRLETLVRNLLEGSRHEFPPSDAATSEREIIQ